MLRPGGRQWAYTAVLGLNVCQLSFDFFCACSQTPPVYTHAPLPPHTFSTRSSCPSQTKRTLPRRGLVTRPFSVAKER